MRHKALIAGMLAVAIAFCMVAANRLSDSREVSRNTGPRLRRHRGCGLAGIVLGVMRLILGRRFGQGGSSGPTREERRKLRKDADRQYAALRERRRLRVAELLADPAKRKYAALVERGEEWSDEQITYHEDRDVTATCPHLQPIERAMRLAGVVPRLLTQWVKDSGPMLTVQADCCINEPELKRQFLLPESVRYVEGYQPERHHEDNPWAKLSCDQCGSAMELVHSGWPRTTTKWFPMKPA